MIQLIGALLIGAVLGAVGMFLLIMYVASIANTSKCLYCKRPYRYGEKRGNL